MQVALPNGEVLDLGTRSAKHIRSSTEIAEDGHGISSIVWHIVAGRPFEWDERNPQYSRRAVIGWLNSSHGEKYVLNRMTDTKDPFGVFPNWLGNLNNEFGSDRFPELDKYITQQLGQR
jgi:hypothetical protein